MSQVFVLMKRSRKGSDSGTLHGVTLSENQAKIWATGRNHFVWSCFPNDYGPTTCLRIPKQELADEQAAAGKL